MDAKFLNWLKLSGGLDKYEAMLDFSVDYSGDQKVRLLACSDIEELKQRYKDNPDIRALSWKQPYAELMLHGKIETRVWDTKYRGLVLICASKRGYNVKEMFDISGFIQSIRIINTSINTNGFLLHPKLGVAIAVGRLVDSRPMTKEDECKCFVEYHMQWTQETKRKDGTTKKRQKRLWCHIYEDVREIEPFEWKGTQGWKVLDQDIIDKIKYK